MKFNIKPYSPICLVFPLIMVQVPLGQNANVVKDD